MLTPGHMPIGKMGRALESFPTAPKEPTEAGEGRGGQECSGRLHPWPGSQCPRLGPWDIKECPLTPWLCP